MEKVSGKGKKSMLCIDYRWLKRSPYCMELPKEWFKLREIVEEDREERYMSWTETQCQEWMKMEKEIRWGFERKILFAV